MDLSGTPQASLQKWLNFPQKHKLLDETKIFDPISNHGNQNGQIQLSEPLIIKTNELLNELNETFEIYQNPKNFTFTFPESMFPEVREGQSNDIRYEQKIIHEQEDTFKNRLSSQQLKQIEETGEFRVKSNIEYITLPYVWSINNAIFWGKKKINEAWLKSLSYIFGIFWNAKNILITQIPTQLERISHIPKTLLGIFFGQKSLQVLISVDYDLEIYKDFWNKIIKFHYGENKEWFHALWSYLYVYYDPQVARPLVMTSDKQENRKKQIEREKLNRKFEEAKEQVQKKRRIIENAHQSFFIEWKKMSKKIILDITNEISQKNAPNESKAESQEEFLVKSEPEDNDQKILDKLADKKFTLYTEHLQKTLPQSGVPLAVISAIVMILKLFSVITKRQDKMKEEKTKRRTEIFQRIKRQHPIKSRYSHYLNKHVNEQMSKVTKAIEDQFYQSLIKDQEFASYLSNDQRQAYKEYIYVKYNRDVLIEAKKKQRPEYHGPSRTFYSNYRLLPPYKVIKDSNNYYTLKKISDDLTVDTRSNFWKLRLYWMRVKTWTINCLVFLSFSVWKGPVGLRNLCGVQDYNEDMNINYQTGQISYGTRSTVLGTFKTVLKGITKSRQQFEGAPDLGLLGKNVSRIFNYIECYIFRFLFVGVFLTLICYPVLIVIASGVIFLLIFTFWAWMPAILLATYVFNIFIKQFETTYISYGCLSRTVPIFRVIGVFLSAIGIIILFILNLLIIAPIRSIFIMAYALLTQAFRRTLDKIMMAIFTHLGRTPSRDSVIAKKISGPGMSKDFYMSINEEDVYVLVRSRLESIYMTQVHQLISSHLQKELNVMKNKINRILKPFGAYYNKVDYISANVQTLQTNYHNQFNGYMKRYPYNPVNVRFTQEQIDSYFPNSVSIVKSYVDRNEINGWIFEKYDLYEGMYDQLTRSIWMQIFGCGEEIFQPLEKLDTRFKLEDQYKNESSINFKMKKNVGSVMKALEGEVELKHHHSRLSPFKHNLLSKEKGIEQIDFVLNIWNYNRLENVSLYLDSVRTLFIPNLNIKELAIIHDEARVNNMKNHKNIVDLE